LSYSPKDLIRILEKNGFVHKRSKGSHHLFENVQQQKTVVVPVHGNKDLPKGTYYAILKQAGIDR
jgi:predicted RNA binding protein YcfA (HicA-like mRNA interferase family)